MASSGGDHNMFIVENVVIQILPVLIEKKLILGKARPNNIQKDSTYSWLLNALLDALMMKIKSNPTAHKAAQQVADSPENMAFQMVLKTELANILVENPGLAKELAKELAHLAEPDDWSIESCGAALPPRERLFSDNPELAALAGAALPAREEATDEMPRTLKHLFEELEIWAVANRRDSRLDARRFWMLKIPAIIVAASGGIFAYFKPGILSVIAGAISSACVLLDGIYPGGQLRNTHYKAFLELRKLQFDMHNKWRIEAWKTTTYKERMELAANIMQSAQDETTRIAAYLRDTETSFDIKRT
jgi:hypothetical protein